MNKPKHAPHSMVMYKVTVNHRGDPEDLFSVNDINGKTLAELFLRFCDSVQGDFITQENSLKHVIVKDSRAIPNRTAALAYLASGSSGEDFEVFDTASAVKESEFDSTRATLVNSRCFVSCDYGDGYALMCIEHSLTPQATPRSSPHSGAILESSTMRQSLSSSPSRNGRRSKRLRQSTASS